MTINLDLPDIEIDIPGLFEIQNELKQTKAQLAELHQYVASQKVWNAALENALKLYGIDISSPHCSSLTLPDNSEFFDPIITNIVSGVVNEVQPQQDRKPHLIRILQENNGQASANAHEYSNDLSAPPHNNCRNGQATEEATEEILSDIWQNPTDEQECEIDVLTITTPFEKDGLDVNVPNQLDDTTNPSSYLRTRFNLRSNGHRQYVSAGNISKEATSPYALPTKSGVVIKSLHSLGLKPALKTIRGKNGRFTTAKKSKIVSRSHGESIVSRHPTPKNSVKLNPGHFIEILPNDRAQGEAAYRCKLCIYERDDLTKVLRHIRVKHLEERKHKCNYCSLRFMRNQHLAQHISAKHRNVATEMRTNRRDSNITKTTSTDVPSSSTQTQLVVSAESKLTATRIDSSIRKQHGDSSAEEIVQSMSETYLTQLRRKYQSFMDEENRTAYLCVECGTINFSEHQMLVHIHLQHDSHQPIATPSSSTLYVCEHCYKTFRTQAFLQFHIVNGHCKSSLPQQPTNQSEQNGSTAVHAQEFNDGHTSNVPVEVVKPTFKMNKYNGLIGGLMKKKKKRYNGVWAFSETEKKHLDSRIENVTNPRPPYVCKICKITINSSRQSARRHVQKVHKYVVEGIIEEQ